MALVKECVVALLLVIVATAVQSATEEDYPQVEVPGVAIPGEGLSARNVDPCCLPDKWQANLTGQIGSSGGRDGGKLRIINNVAIFVDKTGNQIAGKADEGGRFRNQSGGFVMQFKDNKADLYLFRVSDQKCKHVEIKNATFKPQCIPANSTMKEVILGPASGGLKVQAWSFRSKSPEDRRGMRAYVCGTFMVGDKCLPVALQNRGMIRRGRPHSNEDINAIIMDQVEDEQDVERPGPGRRGGIKFVENLYYSSVKDTIDDPEVFTVPKYCNATLPLTSLDSLLFSDDDVFTDVLERYVSF